MTNLGSSQRSQFYLKDFWKPNSVLNYKVHFARWNKDEQPLRVLARSLEEWSGWQRWYPGRNDFNRPYIFSLAQMPEAKDFWMFGGIWEVLGLEDNDDESRHYQVRLHSDIEPLIGRMKLHRVHRSRGTRVNLENHYEHFVVSEIMPERFTGRSFGGYDSVNISFQELECIMANNRQDWATALGHVKGIYLITDTMSRRRYVGSAYGIEGIWSRWRAYVETGHGGNVEMKELLKGLDIEYCRKHFRFTLLEQHDSRVDDAVIFGRESHWKQVLDTRNSESGLNRN